MNIEQINFLGDEVKGMSVEKSRACRRLDEELNYRLEATLSSESKLELAEVMALGDDQSADDEDGTSDQVTELPGTIEYEAEARREDGFLDPSSLPRRSGGKSDIVDQSASASVGHAQGNATEVLAKIEFSDGDALMFEAMPADGEIGVAYLGQNWQRSVAVQAVLASPIRLFASLAPAGVPIPWLLPAIDRPPDREALMGDRHLCDRLDDPIPAVSEVLKLRVTGIADGWWRPKDLTIGGYCGWNGEYEFKDFCGLVGIGEPNPGPGLLSNIYKCTPDLRTDVTHNSSSGGKWRRRRRSIAWAAACGSPVRMTHQYRKLGFFQWKWVTATSYVKGPANLVHTMWMGMIIRRRRIIFKREGNIGGLRARSRFSQSYSD